MPVILGRDEFSDDVLNMPAAEVDRLFLARALAAPLADETAKQRIAGWMAELKRARRRRGIEAGQDN